MYKEKLLDMQKDKKVLPTELNILHQEQKSLSWGRLRRLIEEAGSFWMLTRILVVNLESLS